MYTSTSRSRQICYLLETSLVIFQRRNLGHTARQSNEQLKDTTAVILDSLQKKNGRVLRHHLSWPLRCIISVQRLRDFRKALINSLGPIQAFSIPRVVNEGVFPATKTLVQFQRCNIGVEIRFGFGRRKLLFLYMQSPSAMGLGPPWQSPTYVVESQFVNIDTSVRSTGPWPAVKGILTVPKTPGVHPAVIVLPGSGDGDLDLGVGVLKPAKDLAWGLASKDIVVLRLGKPLLKCGYKLLATRNMTMEDEYVTHNLSGIKLLADHPKVDSSKIFVLGVSLGGRAAPRICTRSPLPIAGMISMAGNSRPLVDSITYWLRWLQEHFPKDEKEFQKEMDAIEQLGRHVDNPVSDYQNSTSTVGLPALMPLKYLLEDKENDPVEMARKLTIPMLFLQGDRDVQVTVEDDFVGWRQGLRAAGGKPDEEGKEGRAKVTFKIYDGLNHAFVRYTGTEEGLRQYDEPGNVDEEVVDDIVRWIRQQKISAGK